MRKLHIAIATDKLEESIAAAKRFLALVAKFASFRKVAVGQKRDEVLVDVPHDGVAHEEDVSALERVERLVAREHFGHLAIDEVETLMIPKGETTTKRT